jgi:hypothetical protein
MAVFGQFTREVGADAAGGTGHESERAKVVLHDNGSELIRPTGRREFLEFAPPLLYIYVE